MTKASAYTMASIWAVALIATSIVLKGTPQSNLVIEILSSCVLTTTIILALSCRVEKKDGNP